MISLPQLLAAIGPQCLQDNICVCCGSLAVSFRDELSRKEYGISGMCQECQDSVFIEE